MAIHDAGTGTASILRDVERPVEERTVGAEPWRTTSAGPAMIRALSDHRIASARCRRSRSSTRAAACTPLAAAPSFARESGRTGCSHRSTGRRPRVSREAAARALHRQPHSCAGWWVAHRPLGAVQPPPPQAVLARRAASLSASGQRQAQPRSCLSRQRGGMADEMPVLPDTMTTRSSRFVTRATEPVVNAALPVTGCRSAMLDRSATSNATRYPSQPPHRGRPSTAVVRARCQL